MSTPFRDWTPYWTSCDGFNLLLHVDCWAGWDDTYAYSWLTLRCPPAMW